MNAYLFNFLQKLKQVRDLVMDAGPGTLRNLAETLRRVAEAADNVGAYIEGLGPTAAMAVAGPGGSETAQTYLAEIQQIQGELRGLLNQPEAAAAPVDPAQAGLMDWLNKINPDTKKFIVGLLEKLITGVLLKSGMTPAPMQPPAAFAGGSAAGPRR